MNAVKYREMLDANLSESTWELQFPYKICSPNTGYPPFLVSYTHLMHTSLRIDRRDKNNAEGWLKQALKSNTKFV